MKYFIAVCLLFSMGHLTSAPTEDLSRLSASICDFIKADDRTSLRKKLKTANLKLRQVYPGLVCQPEGAFPGGSLLRTAAYYGAVDVSSFILRQIAPNEVALQEHDGLTTIAWAEKAVATGAVAHLEKGRAILAEMQSRLAE
jgi:hypothetical protein